MPALRVQRDHLSEIVCEAPWMEVWVGGEAGEGPALVSAGRVSCEVRVSDEWVMCENHLCVLFACVLLSWLKIKDV